MSKKLTRAVPFHETPAKPEKPQAYAVLKTLSYHSNTAHGDVGQILTDLPADAIAWLLEQGAIRPVEPTEEKSEAN